MAPKERMQRQSYFTNPTIQHLPPLKRLRHVRRLQKAEPGAAQNSLLLDLPPELRNRIYEEALISEDFIVVDVDSWTDDDGKKKHSVIKAPELLRTCHLIRSEATALYYTNNRFLSREWDSLVNWIITMSDSRHFDMIRDIRTRCCFGTANYDNIMAYMLHDHYFLEQMVLSLHGRPLRNGVLRVPAGGDFGGGEIALSRDEITSMMREGEWEVHERLNKRIKAIENVGS